MIGPGKWSLGVALLVALSTSLPGLTDEPTTAVRVEIAAPPFEGKVSVGVFNSTGKCIRVLFQNVPQSSIPSALNGFSITWDGRDENAVVAKGEYEIRGVTVGEVTLEGVAYHFNDWIDPDKPTNPPIETQQIKLLTNGDFLAVQKLADQTAQLTRYDASGKSKWSHPLELLPVSLVVGPEKIYLARKNQITELDPETGIAEIWTGVFPGLTSIAISNGGLIGLLGNELASFDSASRQSRKLADLPPNITEVAARGSSVLVSDGSHVFKMSGDHFESIGFEIDGAIQNLAIGKEGSLWIVSEKQPLREFSTDGQLLRELEPDSDEIFLSVDATNGDNTIALIGKKLTRERVRILTLTDSPNNDVSFWKTTLQKEREPCSEFGLIDGKVAANGNLPSEKAISIALIENPLFPRAKAAISVKLANIANGLWLVTKEDLPLLPIAPGMTSRRHLLISGKTSNKLTAFAAVDGTVAEYSLSGLQNMMQFSSEKINWPPGPREKADEENVPSRERASEP